MLKRLGIEVDYYDPHVGAAIADLIKPNTKVVFTKSPASNTFEVQDIPLTKTAHAAGAIVMMDNTWATPLLFKALDFGVDISIHAATKYPAGHSDVLSGTVSANAACWLRRQSKLQRRQCQPIVGNDGDPGRIRTCDHRLRRPVLYPAELRDRSLALDGPTR